MTEKQVVQNKDLDHTHTSLVTSYGCYFLHCRELGAFIFLWRAVGEEKSFLRGNDLLLVCLGHGVSDPIPLQSGQPTAVHTGKQVKIYLTQNSSLQDTLGSVWGQGGWPGLDAGWGASADLACLLRKQGKCRRPCLWSDSSHWSLSQETLDRLRCSSLLLHAKHIHLPILSGDFSFSFPLKKNKQRKRM